MSKLFVVGIGPGGLNHMTFEAHQAIEKADVVVGYKTTYEQKIGQPVDRGEWSMTPATVCWEPAARLARAEASTETAKDSAVTTPATMGSIPAALVSRAA